MPDSKGSATDTPSRARRCGRTPQVAGGHVAGGQVRGGVPGRDAAAGGGLGPAASAVLAGWKPGSRRCALGWELLSPAFGQAIWFPFRFSSSGVSKRQPQGGGVAARSQGATRWSILERGALGRAHRTAGRRKGKRTRPAPPAPERQPGSGSAPPAGVLSPLQGSVS